MLAIDAGNRRWSDWVDLVRQIPPSERVVGVFVPLR